MGLPAAAKAGYAGRALRLGKVGGLIHMQLRHANGHSAAAMRG